MHSILTFDVQWICYAVFYHCASRGMVNEMLAFGKYFLFMPIQSSKCAFMLEAIVGALKPWLSKRCWSHGNFKASKFPMVIVSMVVVSFWPCLWWKMLKVVKFVHAWLLVVVEK
jgi:hypothetical protein